MPQYPVARVLPEVALQGLPLGCFPKNSNSNSNNSNNNSNTNNNDGPKCPNFQTICGKFSVEKMVMAQLHIPCSQLQSTVAETFVRSGPVGTSKEILLPGPLAIKSDFFGLGRESGGNEGFKNFIEVPLRFPGDRSGFLASKLFLHGRGFGAPGLSGRAERNSKKHVTRLKPN